LKPDVAFSISAAMPDFPAWLQIDYFSGEDVQHLELRAARMGPPPTRVPQAVLLGAGQTGVVYSDRAGSPGEDMVVAIAARDRLFPASRQRVEKATDYLSALRAALSARAPRSVSVHALPVTIGASP